MDITISGASGTKYSFTKYEFNPLPEISHCVYIYAYEDATTFHAVYIGITERTFATRFKEHDDDGINDCAYKNKANCVLIHTVGETILGRYTKENLEEIEKDLLNKYNTPCNIKNN